MMFHRFDSFPFFVLIRCVVCNSGNNDTKERVSEKEELENLEYVSDAKLSRNCTLNSKVLKLLSAIFFIFIFRCPFFLHSPSTPNALLRFIIIIIIVYVHFREKERKRRNRRRQTTTMMMVMTPSMLLDATSGAAATVAAVSTQNCLQLQYFPNTPNTVDAARAHAHIYTHRDTVHSVCSAHESHFTSPSSTRHHLSSASPATQ